MALTRQTLTFALAYPTSCRNGRIARRAFKLVIRKFFRNRFRYSSCAWTAVTRSTSSRGVLDREFWRTANKDTSDQFDIFRARNFRARKMSNWSLVSLFAVRQNSRSKTPRELVERVTAVHAQLE